MKDSQLVTSHLMPPQVSPDIILLDDIIHHVFLLAVLIHHRTLYWLSSLRNSIGCCLSEFLLDTSHINMRLSRCNLIPAIKQLLSGFFGGGWVVGWLGGWGWVGGFG